MRPIGLSKRHLSKRKKDMAIKPVKAGIIGCGNISGRYMETCKKLDILDLVACSDIILERAQAAAEKFDIPSCGYNEVVLDNPEVEMVICLTPPKVHTEIMLAALNAGKHAYTEKPFAIRKADGQATLKLAKEKGLLVGGAPDTFFGAGIQTCRKLIDDGAIGRPIAAVGFMCSGGVETWHPDPEFFYQVGGGPMLDMGPYYVTTLVNLLGPVKRVTGSAQVSFAERTITSKPKHGQTIKVETPTHLSAVLDFHSGAVATLVMSFDVKGHHLPLIEIYGQDATMSVPDPNGFGGTVLVGERKEGWKEMPLTHANAGNSRAIGAADMAAALRTGRNFRANGKMAYHVLEVMMAVEQASTSGRHVEIESTCERPAPLPTGLGDLELD